MYFFALRLDNIEFILCFKSALVAAEHPAGWAMVDGGFILVDLPRNLLVQSSCGFQNWKGRSAMLFAKSFRRHCKNEALYTPDAILVHANDLHGKNKSIFTQNGNIMRQKKGFYFSDGGRFHTTDCRTTNKAPTNHDACS